ncbi:hypothetical protein L1049_024152 [Liquidambar formosana]|uniref:KIB1-4 beta-propeller domain-containing protein n=1 Tax=Liquidambar formosana TaxID=63359 RepID=A0AAP0RUE6_LIQFO
MRATADGYAVMAISDYGRLYFLKSGDKEWTAIHEQAEQQSDYTDVINHKGKFYAVTDTGGAIVIDSFRQVSEIAHPIRDGGVIASFQIANPLLGGCQMHLVESLGDLLLVDRHILRDKCKVYKLDEEEREWVEMRSLGDRVVFMDRHSSFSVSARDLSGCKANSIYHTGVRVAAWSIAHARPLRMMPMTVFNLEDGGVLPDEDLGLPDKEAFSWALKAHIGKKKEEERKRKEKKKK